MKKIIVLAIAAAFASAASAATQTIRYDVVAENGTRMGEQVVERDDDGLTRVRFSYKNNGRGPRPERNLPPGAGRHHDPVRGQGQHHLRFGRR